MTGRTDHMKLSRNIITGLAVFGLIAVIVLRWPRLEPEVVSVTLAEISGDQMTLEYRMTQPFEVVMKHGTRTPTTWPDDSDVGIRVGTATTQREDTATAIPSSYDLLRGEHYVRMIFKRGPTLVVDANGTALTFESWSQSDATRAKWMPPSEGTRLGNGVGLDILHFDSIPEREEYLMLYGGTDMSWLLDLTEE